MPETNENYSDSETQDIEQVDEISYLDNRMYQFSGALDQFYGNFNSWLENSRTLEENPEILQQVEVAGNLILDECQQVMIAYYSGTITIEQIRTVDELLISIEDLQSFVMSMIETRNSLHMLENRPLERLSGVAAMRFEAISFIHNVYESIRENFSLNAVPVEIMGIGSISLEDIATVSQESIVESALNNPIQRPVMNLLGFESVEDWEEMKNRPFTMREIPSVAAVVALSIPEELSDVVDAVIDTFEAVSIQAAMGGQRELILSSDEMASIREQNGVLNMMHTNDELSDFLQSLAFNPSEYSEVIELMEELYGGLSSPLELTVEDVATYIMILIMIASLVASRGATLANKAARFSARASANASSGGRTAALWSRTASLMTRIEAGMSSQTGTQAVDAITNIDAVMNGIPGSNRLNPILNTGLQILDTGVEVTSSN
jgi:hypothetical protein